MFKNCTFLLCFYLVVIFSSQYYDGQLAKKHQISLINPKGSTIITRFIPPKGFTWVKEPHGSFGQYLNYFPVKPHGSLVHDYKNNLIEEQSKHVAVLNIDVGDRDLQQCADAWIRLYSEFLWSQNRFSEIDFQFTSGQFFSWSDYKKGLRTKEVNKKVSFISTSIYDDSYAAFRAYLNVIFQYAGTISLDRESDSVLQNGDIKTGDFIITPGSPGHSVIIIGICQNLQGKKLYLLAESYMPAQDIHVLINTNNPQISPWYALDVNADETITAKYIFKNTSVKRFNGLTAK